MRYSVVELAPIASGRGRSAALEQALLAAEDAERTGYHRIWYGEHPGALSYASHDPVPLIAAAAGRTSTIRLGSGAVLLNHYSGLSVAERFMMLESLAPDRIDLGLGRSTAGPVVDYALRRDRRAEPVNDFEEQVQEVVGFVHNAFAPDHPFAAIDLTAEVSGTPDIWVLGSSGSSAGLAGGLGLGYSFGGHINPAMIRPALQRYRESFTQTPFGPGAPRIVLGLNIVAADDETLAHELTWPARALRVGGRDRPMPTLAQARSELSVGEKSRTSHIDSGVIPAQISGTPESLKQQIAPLVRELDVDEIVIQEMIVDVELRQRSRVLIAEALMDIPAGNPERPRKA